ncbi:hypothetical protein Psfp_00628 [Pelotomaculum sp. FP]|nr:hypothetical protein Psfp_00628 [Pelotomaculum sp. FP]
MTQLTEYEDLTVHTVISKDIVSGAEYLRTVPCRTFLIWPDKNTEARHPVYKIFNQLDSYLYRENREKKRQ